MSDRLDWLLALHIQDPKVLTTGYICGAMALFFTAFRRQRRWIRVALVASAIGAIVGAVMIWLAEGPLDVTGVPLLWSARLWIVGCFAALGVSVAAAWRAAWWRRLLTVPAAALLISASALGVNAVYGVNQSVAAVLGRSSGTEIALPSTSSAGPTETGNPRSRQPSRHSPPAPLALTWRAPPDMPAGGRVGTKVIRGTVSGFAARPAGIYLPPAALVPDSPPLPVVVFMFGQPGSPDAFLARSALDNLASHHQGLAPIVVIADQLGNPRQDTLCLNTAKFGNVETYINTDVVNWIKQNLNVSTARSAWTVAGYSNGALCAVSFAAKHPEIWGNVISVSGEAFAGYERQPQTLADIFHGDQAAYDAEKPVNLLANRTYADTHAYFSYGSNDSFFGPGQEQVAAQARRAGINVTVNIIPDGGHVDPALTQGNAAAMAWLYPRLGLDVPSS